MKQPWHTLWTLRPDMHPTGLAFNGSTYQLDGAEISDEQAMDLCRGRACAVLFSCGFIPFWFVACVSFQMSPEDSCGLPPLTFAFDEDHRAEMGPGYLRCNGKMTGDLDHWLFEVCRMLAESEKPK